MANENRFLFFCRIIYLIFILIDLYNWIIFIENKIYFTLNICILKNNQWLYWQILQNTILHNHNICYKEIYIISLRAHCKSHYDKRKIEYFFFRSKCFWVYIWILKKNIYFSNKQFRSTLVLFLTINIFNIWLIIIMKKINNHCINKQWKILHNHNILYKVLYILHNILYNILWHVNYIIYNCIY